MSKLNRSIWLDAPEILKSTYPLHRVLNDVFDYFSAWATDLDPTLVYESTDLTVEDEDGQTMPLDELFQIVGGLMYSDYTGEIRLTNSQAQALQVLPHWSLFLGDYTDAADIQADLDLANIPLTLDQSLNIDVLIAQAKAVLKAALGG